MRVCVNRLSLYYEVSGSGAPLILLHGNGEDHHIFDKLSQKLQQHYTLYALDSRGHGKSQSPTEFSYSAMASDVYGFIVALDLPPVHLLGFSDGAIISLLLGMEHRQRVNKMALLGINLTPEDFTDECYQAICADYALTQNPLDQLMLTEPNIKPDDLKGLDIPTLIVAGENDVIKPETFTNLNKTLSRSDLKIMADHDHESYIVNNDLLYHELLRFYS